VKLVRSLQLILIAVSALGGASSGLAQSQAYPGKIIRLIVGFPPGGAADITARLVGQKMSASLGQTVLIDNRPGANSNIGTEAAARAAPDGYTLLMCTIASTINHSLYRNLPFDLLKDFAPVTQTTSVQSILAIHPSLPVRSVKERLAQLRFLGHGRVAPSCRGNVQADGGRRDGARALQGDRAGAQRPSGR